MFPFAVTDVIDVPWKGLMDMRIWSGDEKLLGVAADGPTVQVWVVDMSGDSVRGDRDVRRRD